MALFPRLRAEALHREAMALAGERDDEALEIYAKTLELDPKRPTTLYNIGLIHKYRRDWAASLDANRRAFALRPGDEAICWNLAIAATALRDWSAARMAWRACGYDVGAGDGPIQMDFGRAAVRLNPDDNGEVVWVSRIDPVRAVIDNIPFQESGYFYRDVVLHDGAALGRRTSGDTDYPVFNVFERFERSAFSTRVAGVESPSQADLDALSAACGAAGIPSEDWTSSVTYLCKACSEGTPHDHHATEGGEPLWTPEHQIAFAVKEPPDLDTVLAQWSAGPGRRVVSVATAAPTI